MLNQLKDSISVLIIGMKKSRTCQIPLVWISGCSGGSSSLTVRAAAQGTSASSPFSFNVGFSALTIFILPLCLFLLMLTSLIACHSPFFLLFCCGLYCPLALQPLGHLPLSTCKDWQPCPLCPAEELSRFLEAKAREILRFMLKKQMSYMTQPNTLFCGRMHEFGKMQFPHLCWTPLETTQ